MTAWEARLEQAWKAMMVAEQVLEFLSPSLQHRGDDRRRAPAADEVTDWLLARTNRDAARTEYNECLSVLEVVRREANAAAVRREGASQS